MSLNWKEIDLILSELPLKGSLVRNIYQPDHHSLILELYNRGGNLRLYISLLTGFTRLHTIKQKPKSPSKPQRFVSFLKAHIRNGRITDAEQPGSDRIVRINIKRYTEEAVLWIRLWGGAANIIVTDSSGKILDAFFRRPKRGEISGGYYKPAADLKQEGSCKSLTNKTYTIRDMPGEGSFNERIGKYYSSIEEDGERKQITASLIQAINIRENRLLSTIEKLEKKREKYKNYSRYRELGDIIKASMHKLTKGDTWLKTEDFFNDNRTIDIELDKRLSPAGNAEYFYKKYRKAKSGLGKISGEIDIHRNNFKLLEEKKNIILDQNTEIRELYELKSEFKTKTTTHKNLSSTGLTFYSHGFIITVGRSAKENDELLRRYARGNDYWFHVRNHPGGYVFIRSKSGKSIPLEAMLDAANLAIYYSKSKSSGQGDIYYTQVKYLRRVKNGKTGLVIPTHEKNLFVKFQPERIKRLKEKLPEIL